MDIKFDYVDLDGSNNRYDFSGKVAFFPHPHLKMNIETHNWNTDVTGQTENDWEQVSQNPILFVKDALLSER